MDLIDFLHSEAKIKNLSYKQADELCRSIRSYLVREVSKTGGHLSSNLGVVEATVALHRVFDFSKDKIVFDVGHQSYTHKILTDRADRFDTLRKKDGLSGFTKPCESKYDAFGAGHSSTSISAALGIATTNKLMHNEHFTVAFIGDGALTGGLAYEGLNNAGRSNTRLLIVLNDNELSISKNVGALAKYLSRMGASKEYFAFKDFLVKVFNKIPFIGPILLYILGHWKDVGKKLLNIKSSNFFEDLGFEYYGTIDGHRLDKLEPVFKRVIERGVPAVVHIKTIKGHGYRLAEDDPTLYHGVSDFNIEQGVCTDISKMSYSGVFGSYLTEIAQTDDKVCAITAAMADGVGLKKFAKQFPTRFFDVGIAEAHAVTFAAGLAANGYKPVFACYSTFLQRGFDQIVHDIAIQNLPVTLAIDRAGFVGEDGETHQGLFDVSMLSEIPNCEIYSPVSFKQLRYVLSVSLKSDLLSCVRYPRGGQIPVCNRIADNIEDVFCYDCEKADIILLGYGRSVKEIEKVKKIMSDKKIGIISILKIKPLDTNKIIKAIGKCKNVIFVEEGMKNGGIGQQLASIFNCKVFAVDDCFVKQATVEQQYEMCKLDCDSIVEFINNEC